MKEITPYLTFFILLFIALISTILHFSFTSANFVIQTSFLSVSIFFSILSIILMTVLFIKHEKPWKNIQMINNIIGYIVAFFVFILCCILLHRLIIMEQAIWFTLPTMLLYEKGCEMYSDTNILVNDMKPLQESFDEYKANLILEKNANLDMMSRVVVLCFMNTSHVTMELPKDLFSYTYFSIQILSLNGNVLYTITNETDNSTFQFNSPYTQSKNGINISSVIAYLYINIHCDIFSESSYNTIQNIVKDIQFNTDNNTPTHKNTIKGIYPNILTKHDFNIRQNMNLSSLDYFNGFCTIKPLQIHNINNFWSSNMSEIGLKNGYYESTYYYMLSPLLKNTQQLLHKKKMIQSQKKGWFSFVENEKKVDHKGSFKSTIYKTILYWFYKTPIVSNFHVYICRTDSSGLFLDGNFGNYTLSLEKLSVNFEKFGFWSITVFDTETNLISSLHSYYSSIKLTLIKFGTDLENSDIFIPKNTFYVVLKFVNVVSRLSTNDIPVIEKL